MEPAISNAGMSEDAHIVNEVEKTSAGVQKKCFAGPFECTNFCPQFLLTHTFLNVTDRNNLWAN